DRVVARFHWPVLRLDATDPDADRRQAVAVGVVARDRLAPDLAGAVESRPAGRRLVSHLRKRPRLVVPAGGKGAPRRTPLPGADGGAAGGEDAARDAGAARRLEDVVGADDVRVQDLVERFARAGARGEVNDRVHALERRRERREVRDVGP